MKYLFNSSLLLTLFILSISSQSAKANVYETAAGEIYYQWVSDSTYRVFFRSYQVCESLPVQANVDMGLSNSCATSTTYVSMPLYATEDITPSCAVSKTKCEDPMSIVTGYKQRVYSALVTLPYRCNSWKFSVVNTNGRIPYIFNLIGSNFCAEATLNNTGTYQGNSSPYFTKFGILHIVDQLPFVFNNMAIDPNGDSLVTEVIDPKTKTSWVSPSTNVTLSKGYPALSIPANPFQTNNSFTVNGTTGQISFTPDTTGLNNVAFLIKKYRNGLLIGSITREVGFTIMPAGAIPVTNLTIANSTGAINTSNGISVCAGQPFSISINLKSTANGSKLSVYDDHNNSMPGAIVSYSNMNQDSVRVTVSWTPNASVSGIYTLGFSITDNNCTAALMPIHLGASLSVNVYNKPSAGTDKNICLGDNIKLNPTGGSNYTWSVLSGTIASLNCTNCNNPVATPVANTQYLLTSGNSAFCGNNKDTINVNVNTNITHPSAAITANPEGAVTPGTSVTFIATGKECTSPSYQWEKNGTDITGAVSNTYTTNILSDKDVISCKMICNDPCASPSKFINASITQQVSPTTISNVAEVTGVSVYPNPNKGNFTIAATTKDQSVTLQILNTFGQKVYAGDVQTDNGKLKENINLHLADGIYILKLNDKTYRFTVSE